MNILNPSFYKICPENKNNIFILQNILEENTVHVVQYFVWQIRRPRICDMLQALSLLRCRWYIATLAKMFSNDIFLQLRQLRRANLNLPPRHRRLQCR